MKTSTFDCNKLKYQLAYGLIIPQQHDPYLQATLDVEEQPEIHGDKVWDSSYLIMDYFRKTPSLKKPTSVLEAGCGWGLLSIYFAKIWGAKVTGIDADQHVFPFLKLHADLNQVTVRTKQSRYETLSKKLLGEHNTIVGSDICFWDELTPALFKLIDKAMQAGVEQIIIADPGRSPFHKLAKQCKKKFNTTLVDWAVDTPTHHDGELLIIQQ